MRTTRTSRALVGLLAGGALLGTGGITAMSVSAAPPAAASGTFTNPVIFADVPDVDVAYDGHAYYMVSTTMYLEPSVPIMRSTDMVHWSIAGYTAPILADTDELALRNGKNAYGRGTWAASIKFHDGTYYVSVGSMTTGKTYVYSTPSIEHGPWTTSVLDGYAHDQSLLFDGDKTYLVYGGGKINLRELARRADGTFAWAGAETTLVDDANVDQTAGLNAEGSHVYKIGDYYYVFMIEWPSGGIRQEVVWRSTSLTPQSEGGVWEGKVVFSQKATVEGQAGDGAAQGGVVQGADGEWYAMLFQDQGPVGRSPQLAHVTWGADGWPTYDLRQTMPVPGGTASSDPAGIEGIVTSDEFDNTATTPGYWNSANDAGLVASAENANNGSNLALQWQWNHNPDNRFWSLTDRPGYLRLTTGSLATSILDARNTLTQRTYGPTSSGAVKLDVSHMKDGDVAGISAYQQKYGYVAVTMQDGAKSLVMRRANSDGTVAYTSAPVPLAADTVYLRAETNYKSFANKASFAYSLDGTTWTRIGDDLGMEYSLAHFVGYRFAIFNYATTTTGGYVDADWFHVSDQIGGATPAPAPCQATASVIDNGGFESGTLAPWTGNGTAKLALTTDATSGTSAVAVTGRTQTGDGPQQSVAGELVAGATYDVGAKVRYTTGPDTKQFNVTVMDANWKAYIMASATVKKGEWTTIKGSYTVPSTNLDLSTAKVFVETVWTGSPDATNDLMDFTVDDVSVTGATTSAFDGGLLDNGGFETGALAPWKAHGAATLAVTKDDKASGACSVLVTGRTQTGDGPVQSVAGELKPGTTYDVSAQVKYTTGPATKQFNVTVQDKTKASIMASGTATKGQWTTIKGTYTVPTTGFDPASASVFVETVWTGTPDKANDLMDFLVDDVAVKAQATTPTHPAGDAAPAKSVGKSNPLVDYQYGADPWAMVYDGRVYEYMTGDGSYVDADGKVVQAYETDASGNIKDNSYGKIQTINVVSSADLVNWTNEGAIKVAGPHGAATWASNSWAPAAAHKTVDGKEKFFLYFANSGGGIGVLTSDSPTGPWKDPIGKPLVSTATPGTAGVIWMFDPAVLVDDDGSAYLYFGGGVGSDTDHPKSTRVIRLGDDMVSTVGSAETIDAPAVFEDSGINKIGDTYYYSYCTNFSHSATIDGQAIPTGTIAYMTSSSPMGPFTYQGTILPNPGAFFGAGGNNHHAMFQLGDQWYITYHAQTVQSALVKGGSLDKEHGYRSTQIDEVTINADGSIAPVTGTYQGVAQTAPFDPYQRIEAETIGWDSGIQDAYVASSGIRVAPKGDDTTGEQVLTNVNAGEWTALGGVDFGATGAATVSADVLAKAGGTVQVRLDSPTDGEPVATLTVPAGDGSAWSTVEATLAPAVTGKHDVYFVFAGDSKDELFDVDAWTFTPGATGPSIEKVSVGEGDTVSGTVTFQVDLGGEATDVKYTYVELNKGSGQTWVTDNTKAPGSTNAGLHPTLVVDTTTLANGVYGLKIDAVGTNGKTTEKKVSFTINNAPRLSFVTPKDGSTVSGKVSVTVELQGQGLKAYNLRVDAAGLSYVASPKAGEQTFTWDTTTVADGVRTLLATATDDAGNKTTITEKVTVANTPAWDASKVYTTGDKVGYSGSTWLASWWTQNQKPGDPYGPWQEIATASDGTASWTASRIFNSGDKAVYQGVTYQAQWWTRNEKPGAANGPWKKLG